MRHVTEPSSRLATTPWHTLSPSIHSAISYETVARPAVLKIMYESSETFSFPIRLL